MIATVSGFERLTTRLTTAADRIARANAQFRAGRAAVGPTHRWRRAALLWPLFTKG